MIEFLLRRFEECREVSDCALYHVIHSICFAVIDSNPSLTAAIWSSFQFLGIITALSAVQTLLSIILCG
jgi:hypothetical protein